MAPDDTSLSRRLFVAGAAAAPVAASAAVSTPETVAKALYASMSPAQRAVMCLPWTDPRRSQVGANWAIVNPDVSALTPDQRAMVVEMVQGLVTPEWLPRVMRQMQDDSGGIGAYHIAFFGTPSERKFEWVMTGRHVTFRADGHTEGNAAFGGPVFYGHAPKFNEDPGHPGNIYWCQGILANKVFGALDPDQRRLALLDRAPAENTIRLQGSHGSFAGVPVGSLHRDQRALVRDVLHSLLAPWRPSDAAAVVADLHANGDLDALHLAFYRQDALAHDGTWDIWRLEGPAFVWHFRGAPHVHTWVNVARRSDLSDAHA